MANPEATMAASTANRCFALLILLSLIHLSAESQLRTLKQFCTNSGDCFHLIGLATQVEGKVLVDSVSWDEAYTKCRSVGGRLAVVNNGELQSEIVRQFTNVDDEAFKTEGSKHVWIAGRKDDKWRWIDGKEYNESQLWFSRDYENTKRCAVATHNAGVQTSPCESEVPNYVCTFKNKECPGGQTHEGWQGSTCIGTYNEGRNWLDARRACRSKGGDLFTLLPGYDDTSLGRIINTDEKAWIGLQRGLWQWVVPRDGSQANETKPMQYWNWDEGESSHSDGEQCLSMDLQTRAKWEDKTCHFSKYFICENILPRTTTTSTTTTGSPIPPPSPSVSWPRPTGSRTTRRSATVLPTAPTTKPASISTAINQMLPDGIRDTLSSTATPALSTSVTTLIAVTAVLAFIVVIVVVGFILKFRYMGSQMKILHTENAQLRRSESGNPPEDVRPENINPLPAIRTSSESTDNNGLYTGLGPRDPPSTTPSVYSIPYAEVSDVPPYANLPGGVL